MQRNKGLSNINPKKGETEKQNSKTYTNKKKKDYKTIKVIEIQKLQNHWETSKTSILYFTILQKIILFYHSISHCYQEVW